MQPEGELELTVVVPYYNPGPSLVGHVAQVIALDRLKVPHGNLTELTAASATFVCAAAVTVVAPTMLMSTAAAVAPALADKKCRDRFCMWCLKRLPPSLAAFAGSIRQSIPTAPYLGRAQVSRQGRTSQESILSAPANRG